MKKLMKAIAFATVMCMLLSTAAFAATETTSKAEVTDYTAKTLSITVDTTDATSTEQVSLVVVTEDGEIATDDILYVGQTAAVAGKASFTATITDSTVTAVDVYAGNATYAGKENSAELVAKGLALTAPITEATVTVVSTKIAEGTQNTADPNHTGGGVGMIVNFELPTGVKPVKIIWSVRSGEEVYYTPSIDISGLSVLTGGVQLGASFINGSIADNVPTIAIDGAHAIFLFSNDKVVYTDEATDKDNAADGVTLK